MKSLRSRLIVWLILGITLFLATSGFAIHAIVSSQMRSGFDRSLLATARSLDLILRREIVHAIGESESSPFPHPALALTRPDLLFELRHPGGEPLVSAAVFEGAALPALARGARPTSFGAVEDLRFADLILPPDGRTGRALAYVLGPPPRPDRPERADRPGRPGPFPGRRPSERMQLRGEEREREFRDEFEAGDGSEGTRDRGRRDRRRDELGDERPGRPRPPGGGPGRSEAIGFEVVLAGDTTELLGSLRNLRLLLLLAWLSCSLGCAGILSWVVHRSLRPLGRLSRQIEGLSGDGLKKRFVLPDAPAELEPVVAELNLLLARIQEAFDREQAFTADAAHELRTPLAGLRSTIELALNRERSSAEYRQSAEASLAITEEMQSLVGDLLTLSRMASTQVEARCVATPLAGALAVARERFEEEARRRGLDSSVDVDGDLALFTDPALLERVLLNLVENAVTYADENSSIEFRAAEEGDSVLLLVSNQIMDAPDDLAEKAFLAFWRADSSRSMLDDHAGLGLSLCRRIVQQLDGRIDAEFEGGRFTVRLLLPGVPERD